MIDKVFREHKARWVYECQACDHRHETGTDRLSALEEQQRHQANLTHAFAVISQMVAEAARGVADAYMKATRAKAEEARDA